MKRALSFGQRGGFTLVEILVSMTVLGLMMVGVAQMLNSAALASMGGYKHLDADTQARLALDRIALDISKMSRRGDVDYFLKTSSNAMAGNDQMMFYSEAGGYYPSSSATSPDSSVSLVGYRINSTTLQLERLSKGLLWNGSPASANSSSGYSSTDSPAMVFGTSGTASLGSLITSNWQHVQGSGADGDYQVIGDQIFRLEYCYLVSWSNESTTYAPAGATAAAPIPTSTAPTLSLNPYAAPDTTPNGLQDVVAIVVSIAVLDAQSQKIATSVNSTAMTTAAADLDDAPSTVSKSNLPLTLWKADLTTTHPNLGLPKSVAGQVRFYQRYCYLSHAQ